MSSTAVSQPIHLADQIEFSVNSSTVIATIRTAPDAKPVPPHLSLWPRAQPRSEDRQVAESLAELWHSGHQMSTDHVYSALSVIYRDDLLLPDVGSGSFFYLKCHLGGHWQVYLSRWIGALQEVGERGGDCPVGPVIDLDSHRVTWSSRQPCSWSIRRSDGSEVCALRVRETSAAYTALMMARSSRIREDPGERWKKLVSTVLWDHRLHLIPQRGRWSLVDDDQVPHYTLSLPTLLEILEQAEQGLRGCAWHVSQRV